jgi:hypothetical protein
MNSDIYQTPPLQKERGTGGEAEKYNKRGIDISISEV